MAGKYVSDQWAWDGLRSLAKLIQRMRDTHNLLIFDPSRFNDPSMISELHTQHLDGIRRQANLEEKAANGEQLQKAREARKNDA